MIEQVLAEAALGVVAERMFSALLELRPSGQSIAKMDTSESRDSIAQHLAIVNRWAADISFRDMWRSKSLQDSFVNLDLRVGINVDTANDDGVAHHVSDLASMPGHLVLVGEPGAGKTTSLKKVAQDILARANLAALRAPVLIQFRELLRDDTLSETLLRILGVSTVFDGYVSEKNRATARLQLAAKALDDACGVLLLDGLDEFPHSSRDHIVDEIRELCLRLNSTRIILTCRTGDYYYHIDGTSALQLRPLSKEQIRLFAVRWLGRAAAERFIENVEATPYSGTEVRPLTLAHLCAIYERSGTVPDKPRTVYRKIIRLFLEEWDEQRSVRRHSQYAGFAVDRKEEFLEAIAYYIARQFGAASFSDGELREAYLELYGSFGLPKGEATKVIREIQSHTGLIIQVTADRFEFAHKSLQEYLAACYIAKLPAIPRSALFELPNEAAISVALSSRPSAYFITLLRRLQYDSYTEIALFSEPFVQRLILERVDWVASKELGTELLNLFSLTCFPNGRRSPRTAAIRAVATFHRFLREEPLARSIAIVLTSSFLLKRRDDLFGINDGTRGSVFYEHTIDTGALEFVMKYCDERTVQKIEAASAT